MNIEIIIINIITALLIWIAAFTIYMQCNKGVSHIARGQQFRRYLLASVCAIAPVAVTNTDLCQPAIFIAMIVAASWMITFPLLYHMTNKHMATEYDNQIDIAFGIYIFGWLTGILVIFPAMTYAIGFIEILFLIIPISQWVYYFVCKGCVNVNGMKMLQETHYNEIIEFLRSYHPLKVLAVASVIIGLCVCVITANIYNDFKRGYDSWENTIIAAAVTLFMTIYMFKKHHGLFIRTGILTLYQVVKEYAKSNSQYVTDMKHRISTLKVESSAGLSTHPSTIMLVIGESASRDFMSAFTNTDTDTTPWMKSMSNDNQHCIIFPNAYSCDIQTVPTLEKSLTEYNQYDGGKFHTSCSIVDIAHKLGWKVHWYSNQGHLGAAETPITLVAETADVAKWTRQELNKVQYDENLIDFLDEVNPEVNNLVVLHLKGSHFNFENRFPKDARQWGKAGDDDDITNYKNSLHYTDSVLRRFYEYGRKRLNMQAMVYFSDHGCVPDRHRLPNFGGFGDTRIPLMVWISDEYKTRHPQRADALLTNKNLYWTNDLAYELICGIMDIKSNHFNEYNSLASHKYRYTRNMLVAMGGKIKISDDIKQ